MFSKKKKISSTILFIFVLLYALLSLYPLLWTLIQSFKTETEFLQSIWTLPSKLDFSNFEKAWVKANFSSYFMNSIITTVLTVIVDLLLVTMVSFVFAKLNIRFKKFWYYFIIFNMLIPTPVTLLPMFFVVRDLGIQNTYASLIFPYFQGLAPFGVIICTNYFKELPDELMEAAKLDGCSTFKTYYQILLPLARPIMATIVILAFMGAWNEYMWALISLSDTSKYTLPIGIAVISGSKTTFGYTTVFAALTISTMVVVVLFLICQKQFVKSITAGAVKG